VTNRENATTAVVADIVASIRARLGKQLGGRARLDGCLTPWLMLARRPLPPENCPSASELLRHQLVRVIGLLAALRLLPVGELHLPVRQLLVRDVRKKRRSLVIRQAWSVSSEGALCYRVAADSQRFAMRTRHNRRLLDPCQEGFLEANGHYALLVSMSRCGRRIGGASFCAVEKHLVSAGRRGRKLK